jgi:hypothetical protein
MRPLVRGEAEASAPDLEGDVAKIGLVDLVQFLDASQHPGALRVVDFEGHEATLTLGANGVSAAECGHLRGFEAMLAMLGWHRGHFTFVGGASDAPAVAGVPAVVMESVRLEDELDRLIGDLPPEEAALKLRPARSAEAEGGDADPLGCGLALVVDTLRAHPGVKRAELEQLAPLSPIKVRLSLCQLAHRGDLHTGKTVPPPRRRPSIAPASDWYARLSAPLGGSMRVLVATSAACDSHDLTAWVHGLAEAIDAEPTSISLGQSGPSFVRLRRRDGALLSLTFLPMCRKHRYLFHSFASSARISLFTEDAAREELEDWRAQLHGDALGGQLIDERSPHCLARSMRALAEARP